MPAAFDNGSWIVCNQYIIPWFFQALLQSAVVSVPDLERSWTDLLIKFFVVKSSPIKHQHLEVTR